MSNIVKSNEPKALILQVSHATDPALLNKFMKQIDHLYQYEIFKPLLDLVATKIASKNLVFKIEDMITFSIDEGNCRTIESNVFDKLLNRFKKEKNYVITIKQITPPLIMHELSHLMEQETGLKFGKDFADAVLTDLKHRPSNPGLSNAIEQVMVSEVKAYHESQKGPELLARYFQLLAASKEVTGFASKYGYGIKDAMNTFPSTQEWIINNAFRKLATLLNQEVVRLSKLYIKAVEEIKHAWSEQKIESFHKTPGKSAWSKSIKPLLDEEKK